MKIIDADSHISSVREGIRITAEEWVSKMDELNIERALIWLHPNQLEDEYCDFDGQNQYIYEVSQKYPDRFLAVGWINPSVNNMEEMITRVKQQICEYGLKGIKFNGAQNFYSLANEELFYPVMDEVVRLGGFLAFHCGNDENTNPKNVMKIAKRYKDAKILMVHMGQTLCDDAIEVAKECPNVLLIGSGMPDRNPVLKAYKELGSKRVCFGSDAPFFDTKMCIDEYKEILGELTKEDLEDIFYNNIFNFYYNK